MIIKSHIRGGYRAAADYLKEQGKNEKTRLVQISDPDAMNLDEAFHNMWTVANSTKATKPLHHISINPQKDEQLTDAQVLKIVERCEQKYGYKPDCHQRVIVEHIKDGRQHFHVIWNRVSLDTRKAVWPGEHWKKSKQVCREMEKELGLKRPVPKKVKRMLSAAARAGRQSKHFGRYQTLQKSGQLTPASLPTLPNSKSPEPKRKVRQPKPFCPVYRKRKQRDENALDSKTMLVRPTGWEADELLGWAWENRRFDILRDFGVILPPDYFEP